MIRKILFPKALKCNECGRKEEGPPLHCWGHGGGGGSWQGTARFPWGAMQCEPGIPVLFKEASFLFQQQQCAQLLQTGKVGPFLYCGSAGNPEFPCEHIFRINFAYMQRKLVRRKVVSKGKSKPLWAERGLCCSSWPRVSVNAGLQLRGSYSARVSVLQHL